MQEKTNLTAATISAKATSSRRLRGLFYGPSELRAGWRFLIFAAIVMSLLAVKAVFIRLLPHGTNQATTYLVDKTLKFAVFLLASWIMAKVEARTIADYGLPRRKMFGQQFWQGAVLAFVCLTGFLIALRIAGLFRFGEISLHGLAIWKWAALYSFGFIIVALEEEFHYRGYGLYTLSQGMGFWSAAVLSSVAFGCSHLGNSGENWLGVFNASTGGLLFCFLLRRSGNLWMPIGFHAAWDWAQTYFYGVPDSGHTLPGRLFDGNFVGSRWLTGGSVGPEGSVLFTLLLILFWLSVSALLRETRYPAARMPVS